MMVDVKRLFFGRKNENGAEAPAESPKKPRKKLLIGLLGAVVTVGAAAYMFSPYLFPATQDYPAAPAGFSNNPSGLFGPASGAARPPAPSLSPSGGEPAGFPADQPEASPETLGPVASGASQSPGARGLGGPVAPSEGSAMAAPGTGVTEEPSPEAATVAAGRAVKMGRKIYNLQYDLELKRLQLELAKLDAEIAEQSAKMLPPPVADKAEDSEADAPELPKPGLAPSMLPMLSVGDPVGEQGGKEKSAEGLTAVTEDRAIIDGKVVRVGGVYNGMKVVAVNPRLGLVRLRSAFGGEEIEMSM